MNTSKLTAALILLASATASAQATADEIDDGISGIKVATFDYGAEVRFFDAKPEFILDCQNISADWIHADKDFVKVKLNREIFSLMGTGLEWNVGLNAVGGNFSVLPSVGFKLYARIRPRLDLYLQFDGLTLGGRAHVTDFESGLRYCPRRDFSISAGWRDLNFHLRHGGAFHLRGLFTGVRYEF